MSKPEIPLSQKPQFLGRTGYIVPPLDQVPALGTSRTFPILFWPAQGIKDLFHRPIDMVEIKAIKNRYLLESINKSRRQIYAA